MALRCLIVDDSDEFVASATRLLESQGMRVIGHARDGQKLVDAAQRDHQLVVADRPPAASKAKVRGVGSAGSTIGIDLIAVTNREKK